MKQHIFIFILTFKKNLLTWPRLNVLTIQILFLSKLSKQNTQMMFYFYENESIGQS